MSDLPHVPYGKTARRPSWDSLPAAVREAIGDRLASPVTDARMMSTGFTNGFAAVLATQRGRSVFVKAAPQSSPVASWYEREASITAVLPHDAPTARLLWAETLADHYVICLQAIDGTTPAVPWTASELRIALDAHARAVNALGPPPMALADLVTDRFGAPGDDCPTSLWQQVMAGTRPIPRSARHVERYLPKLVGIEGRMRDYCDNATGILHYDLRADNIIIAGGTGYICDWNWLRWGPVWLDTAMLLLSAQPAGHDVDALFHAHPASAGAPADALDAALTVMAAMALTKADLDVPAESPHLRGHQRRNGLIALQWLAKRQGW